MNTARNRHAAKLVLQLSQWPTAALTKLVRDTKQTMKVRRAAAHVLMARAITK